MKVAAFFMWFFASITFGIWQDSTGAALTFWLGGLAYAWYWFKV
jgi:hypothetical protein